MKKKSLIVILAMVIMCSVLLTGCYNVTSIPAGFAGKILTPTGWQEDWKEAGQVDLGQKNGNGTYNQLVLLELTSTTVMESFNPAKAVSEGGDNEDHRVLTRDGVPVSVDVYVRLIVPPDKSIWDKILAEVTPIHYNGDQTKGIPADPSEVQRVFVSDIYTKFAQPEVRGAIRTLFASYDNYEAVYSDFANLPKKLGDKLAIIFKDSDVPLNMMQVSLSNVKPDEALWAAKNQQAAAEAQVAAIKAVGQAMKDNPGYVEYMKWEYLLKIAQTGTNVTIVIGDGGSTTTSGDFAASQWLLQQLEKDTASGIYTPGTSSTASPSTSPTTNK